jgi:hypothetical protein
VVFIPVLLEESECIYSGQNVEIYLPSESEALLATIYCLNNSVNTMGVNQVRIAVALIHTQREKLMPGMLIKCNIDCGSMTILEYISGFFNQIFIY